MGCKRLKCLKRRRDALQSVGSGWQGLNPARVQHPRHPLVGAGWCSGVGLIWVQAPLFLSRCGTRQLSPVPRSRAPGALSDVPTLQPLKKCLLPATPCESLIVTSPFLGWLLHGTPSPFPTSPSPLCGTHLRPHWKRLGAPQRLAFPFYTCPAGLSQQNLKKKKRTPPGLQWAQ